VNEWHILGEGAIEANSLSGFKRRAGDRQLLLSSLNSSIKCHFYATIRKTVRPMLSDRCPVCSVLSVFLSVTLVYCGQTVVWIKMKLGMEVDLGPGHIVLDGDPAPTQKEPQPTIFGHVRCGQTAGWTNMSLGIEVGLCLGPLGFVLGADTTPPKRAPPPPNFGPNLLWLNGWMDQDVTWYGGRPRPR